jgi:hypothetical protein
MSTQFNLPQSVAVAMMAAVTLGACDSSLQREGPAEATLRVERTDAARNRLWVLEREALTLYDNTTGRRLRRMVLPEWVLLGARYSCPPDLALDPSGAVFVSSNVLPVLWRIGPQRFDIARIELALHTDADKDVGFTGLSFAGDGTLLAAGTTFGSLWHLDPRTASARKIASYPAFPSACDPAALLRASREQPGSVVASSQSR